MRFVLVRSALQRFASLRSPSVRSASARTCRWPRHSAWRYRHGAAYCSLQRPRLPVYRSLQGEQPANILLPNCYPTTGRHGTERGISGALLRLERPCLLNYGIPPATTEYGRVRIRTPALCPLSYEGQVESRPAMSAPAWRDAGAGDRWSSWQDSNPRPPGP